MEEFDGASPPNVTATMLAGLAIDQNFARTDSSGTVAMLRDAIGSTIGLVDPAGALATQYTYQPFGATTLSGTSSSNPVQFAGREMDQSGLYYMRARYYNPVSQRFISPDPTGLAAGINRFAYVDNSPLNMTDPMGLVGGAAFAGGGTGGGQDMYIWGTNRGPNSQVAMLLAQWAASESVTLSQMAILVVPLLMSSETTCIREWSSSLIAISQFQEFRRFTYR